MLALRLLRTLGMAVAAAALCGSALASTARITAIDTSRVTALPGNVSPRVAAAKDLGAAPAAMKIQEMSLRFTLTDAQQSALTTLLANLQDPSSPQYHQWLTPETFAAQFGLAADDLAKITSWLTAHGFTITEVSRGGLYIKFSGTVAQANQAFGVQVHNVTLNGVQHIANLTAPSLPAAIAAVTAGITGLDDFRPRPHVRKSAIEANARPNYTSSTGGHYMAPGDFYTIYDVSPLFTSSIKGSGITIAVVGQTDVSPADIATFRSVSGLSVNAPTVVLPATDPGVSSNISDVYEATLDLEWSGAIAPSASILYVNSSDAINGSLTYAIDNNIAPIISDSYGDCEPDLGTGALAYYNSLLAMAASEGITITAAAGDDGATDCDYSATTVVTTATHGLAVDFPADSPYVTGVGGTEFNEGSSTYWSSTNGTYQGSALSYIPEIVWNDDALGAGLSATGGGASAYFAKPSWQTGTGVPSDYARDVPDVAISASPNHDPYIICIEGSCVTGYNNASGKPTAVGGTSVGAPTFAGLLALVEQKTGSRIGVANNTIYALAGSGSASSVFHDVVSGNNDSPCTSGSTNCPNGGSIGFSATLGYDQTTGWGSVNAYNLVNGWASVTPYTTTTGSTATYTTVAGSATTVTQGTAITLTATVTSSSTTVTTTPTGSVEITVDGVGVGSATLNSSGVATYLLSTSSLSIATHTVQATYLGNTTYLGSRAAFSLAVDSTTQPDFSLSPASATITASSGSTTPGAVLFTVSALNGFTGSVSLAAITAASGSTPYLYSFTINPVTLSTTATSATTTFDLFAYTAAAKRTTGQITASARRNSLFYTGGSGMALAGLLLVVFPRRRRLGSMLLLMIMAAGAMTVSGCNNAVPVETVANTPTPTGTYTVTVQATATVNSVQTTHYATVTFTVQ